MRGTSSAALPSWQRNLGALWVGELIAIAGFSVTLPFLPYYVQDLGITEVKQVAFWAGLLTTCQATTMALVAPVWGMLADRYGRKVMVERAMFGGAVVIAAMGFTQNVYQLGVLRAIQGLLTGTVPAATTLVASGTPPERRGFALGVLQMAVYLGSSVGPWLGGLVADRLGYRATFWVTGGLLFVAGVLVALLVQEQFTPLDAAADADATGPGAGRRPGVPFLQGLALVLRSRALMMVFGIRLLANAAVQVTAPILPLFIQGLVAPGTRVASVTGTIAGFTSATSAAAAILWGRAGDKIGPRKVLLVCIAAAAVLYVLQSGVQTSTQLLVLRAILGGALGGILASVSNLLATFTPRNRYGTVYGVDTSMMAASNAIAPMIGAALTATWGLSSTFLGSAAMYLIALGVVATMLPARPNSQAPLSRAN